MGGRKGAHRAGEFKFGGTSQSLVLFTINIACASMAMRVEYNNVQKYNANYK